MWVTRIIGKCPGCGELEYGNVMIQDDELIRGCGVCKYNEDIWLPPIKKKVVYLDQFFFSNAFKEKDKRFVEAAERIRRLSALQLLVAPYSSIHEQETHQWTGGGGKGKEALMKFIKDTSRGHEFKPAYEIEHTQIFDSFFSFLRSESSRFDRSDAFSGSIDSWDDYHRVDVRSYVGDIELVRRLKQESLQALVDAFSIWKDLDTTFDQDFNLEVSDSGRGYLKSYVEFATRVINGDMNALFDAPLRSRVVEMLIYGEEGEARSHRLMKICEYFKSTYFTDTPYTWITCRLLAVLRHQVKNGSHTNREGALKKFSGLFHDVEHIGTYAPYCDAFFMDKAMAEIAADRRLSLEQKYGVRVFSLNNLGQFFDWCDEVEASMSAEHREGIQDAYPSLLQ